MSQFIKGSKSTLTVEVSDTTPSSPFPYMLWLDISGLSPVLKCWNTSTWVVIGGAGTTANVAVAKVGGGTRTLAFGEGHYINYTDS
jgi:hypothetical protein